MNSQAMGAGARVRARSGRSYYSVLTGTLLGLGLVAFSDNLFTDVGQPSNGMPRMVVHGLFALAWMVLLFVQAALMRSGDVARHKALGPWTFAVGAGLIASTGYLFFSEFAGFDAMPPYVLSNRIFLVLFAIAVVFAWRRRHLGAWHKRLLVLGTVLTLGPVLSRAMDRILGWMVPGRGEGGVDPLFMLAFAGVWTALLASHWVYDYRVLGRIHPVTVGATVALYGVFILVYSI